MRSRLGLAVLGLLCAVSLPSATLAQQLPADFSTVRDVPLPGNTSRFDYESLDPQTHRLYITHLGAGTIPVRSAGPDLGWPAGPTCRPANRVRRIPFARG